jgi:hypothetical protein
MLTKYLIKSEHHKMVIYWSGNSESLRSYASTKWNCAESDILLIQQL